MRSQTINIDPLLHARLRDTSDERRQPIAVLIDLALEHAAATTTTDLVETHRAARDIQGPLTSAILVRYSARTSAYVDNVAARTKLKPAAATRTAIRSWLASL